MKDDFSFEAQFGSALDQNSPVESEDTEQPRQEPVDMTRSQQTFWVVLTIAAFGLAILYHVTRLPEGHPYAKCQRIIGSDGACRADVAIDQMRRGY